MRKFMASGWVHLLLTLVTISWGFNNIALKFGFAYVTPEQFSGIRLIMALPFMLFFTFLLPNRVPFSSKDFWLITLVGLVGLGVFQTLFPIGIDETSAPLGGILMATMPIHVVVISLVFRLERPQLKSILGVFLTIAGLALITFSSANDGTETHTTLRGILFVVLSELGYAVNTTFLRNFMKRYPPLQVTGLAMSVSVLFYLLVNLGEMRSLTFAAIHPVVWATATYSGLVAFLLANVIWNLAVKHIGSTQVSVYGNLPPVFVMLLSAIFFQELLNGWQLVGSLVILGGVVLVQMRKQPTAEESLASVLSVDRQDP